MRHDIYLSCLTSAHLSGMLVPMGTSPGATAPMPPVFEISYLQGQKDRKGERLALSWPELVEVMTTHEVGEKAGPAFSPYVWKDDIRMAAGAEKFGLVVADIDDSPRDVVMRALEELTHRGISWVAYSSYSFRTDRKFKCRVIVPLSEPIPAVKQNVRVALASLGLLHISDQKCIDTARLFFLPRFNGESLTWTGHNEGEAYVFEVDALPAIPSISSPKNPPVNETSKYSFSVARKYLQERAKKGWGHDGLDITVAVDRLLKGERFAEVGERDTTVFAIANALAYKFPDAPASGLASIFDASLEAMSGDDDPITRDLVVDKLERALEAVRNAAAAEAFSIEVERQDRIREAFRRVGLDRGEPYTDDEMAEYSKTPHEWIIYSGRKYYFKIGDRYSPGLDSTAATIDARFYLAPAEHAGINHVKVTENGLRPMKAEEIAIAHGSTAYKETAYTYLERYNRYVDGQIWESVYSEPAHEPKFHDHVDTWLHLFGGESYDNLKAWLWLYPQLGRQCPVLLLHDAPGTGKNLLVTALGGYWGRQGYSNLNGFFRASGFNDDILANPLLVMSDEESGVEDLSEKVKDLVTRSKHNVQSKYGRVNQELHGYMRVVLCSNNVRQIFKGRRETPEGLRALAERFVDIEQRSPGDSDHVATEYLKGLPQETRDAMRDREICEHVAWLYEFGGVTETAGTRFGIPTGLGETVRNALLNKDGTLRWLVLQIIYETVSASTPRPGAKIIAKRGGIRVEAGGIWISPNRFVARFKEQFNKPQTAAEEVRTILKEPNGVLGTEKFLTDEDGSKQRFYKLDTRVLYAWMEHENLDLDGVRGILEGSGKKEGEPTT